jgi:hypothetical protein
MKAILFCYSLPRLAFAYLQGTVSPRACLAAPGPLALEEIPEPELTGDEGERAHGEKTGARTTVLASQVLCTPRDKLRPRKAGGLRYP